MQSWCAVRTSHCNSEYDVTIATFSLSNLYLPKIKNASFVALVFSGLSFACATYSLIPTEWTTRANNTSWRRKTLNLLFEWRGPRVCREIQFFLWFYITLCPHCVITSHLICTNQKLEWLCKQGCYHNFILHHLKALSNNLIKKVRFICTLMW